MIKYLDEEKGGIQRLDIESHIFKENISTLHITNNVIINGICIWNNKMGGKHQIACKLGRFLNISKSIRKNILFWRHLFGPSVGLDH